MRRRVSQLFRCAVLLSTLLGASAASAADRLATGDYAPLVGSDLPNHGVTAEIVRAALLAVGREVELDFLPWKRGFVETEYGRYVATFPYLKTSGREAVFFYSDEIFRDHFDIFITANLARPLRWKDQVLCIPRGYDQSQIGQFITLNNITVETPGDIESCFLMLKAKRVSGVWVSELVAAQTIRRVFATDDAVVSAKLNLVGDVGYYVIAPRGNTTSAQWLAQFNLGLKKIRSNGSYQRIVNRSMQR